MALKIKIKKNTLVRKIDGVKKTGYYGKVIANGTKSFEDIVKQSTHGSTLDDAGASLAPHSLSRGFTYPDGYRETERFADIVEQARMYILTDCGGSFEKFAEWGLIRAKDV